MKYKKTDNGFTTMLSSLIVLLLVVMVISFFANRTNDFTTTMKEFYVTCGNDDITADRQNFDIVINKTYRFDIHNDKDNLLQSESNYSVKIVPNVTSATTFVFNVEDTQINYADVLSLSNYFNVNVFDTHFTICATSDLTEMLQDFYKTDNIVNCPTTIDSGLAYYRLVIASDNNDTININFNLISE